MNELSRYLLQVLLALALLTLGFGAGWKVDNWRQAKVQLKTQLKLEKERDAYAKKLQKKSADYERSRAALQTQKQYVVETVREIVDRPVYQSDCFDDDGLRELNSAIRGTASSASQPSAAMSAPTGNQK